LDKDSPDHRPIHRLGQLVAQPILADFIISIVGSSFWQAQGGFAAQCSFCRAQRIESSLPREHCLRIDVARFVA
jgi:hypothetical protein